MEFREIFRVVAKWSDNNGFKILWKSLENWLTGYQKANFQFRPSSTVGQTLVDYKNSRLLKKGNTKRLKEVNIYIIT